MFSITRCGRASGLRHHTAYLFQLFTPGWTKKNFSTFHCHFWPFLAEQIMETFFANTSSPESKSGIRYYKYAQKKRISPVLNIQFPIGFLHWKRQLFGNKKAIIIKVSKITLTGRNLEAKMVTQFQTFCKYLQYIKGFLWWCFP